MSTQSQFQLLVVEDSLTAFARISGLLSQAVPARYTVTHATTLTSGLDQAARTTFDAVLLDLTLPDSSGVETCVRLHSACPRLPIVVLTGTEDDEVALAAVQSGAQDYLVKQCIDGPLLDRTIRYAIERSRLLATRWNHEERLRLMAEQLPAVLWTTDTQLQLTSAIGVRPLPSGQLPAEMVGRDIAEAFGGLRQTDEVIAAHRSALTGRRSRSVRIVHDGMTLDLCIEPLRDAQQHLMGTVGIIIDVTDHRRMAVSLHAAAQMQRRMLPDPAPRISGFDVFGHVYSADETSGDYLDFLSPQNGQFDFALGDVVGHGLGAAFIMTQLRAYLRALRSFTDKPGDVLTTINRFLCDDLDTGSFVTLFFGRLNPTERTLSYAAAGHCGYLLPNEGEVRRLDSTGMSLGLEPAKCVNTSQPVHLANGDILLVVTDGFQESIGANRDLFGSERVIRTVLQHRHRSGRQILSAIYEAVREFRQQELIADDMSAVIIRANFDHTCEL